jgi:aryl-alcohol dehydrogenase-like predicted oxidoreductase
MKYRSLGRTGVQVSQLTFGSMLLHEIGDRSDAARLIDLAIDRG